MWQNRQWRRLLNLIDGLPRNSLYSEALAADTELAQSLLDLEMSGQVPPPEAKVRISEWSPEREADADIVDWLKLVYGATVGAATGKAPKFEPSLRPVTEMQRLRREADMRVVFDFAARVTPSLQDHN